MRRAGAVLVDGDRHGHHLTGLNVTQLRPRAAVNHARGQMKQQIHDPRLIVVEQPRVELLQPWPDAGEAGEGGKQGIEHGRAHGRHCNGFREIAAPTNLVITGLVTRKSGLPDLRHCLDAKVGQARLSCDLDWAGTVLP